MFPKADDDIEDKQETTVARVDLKQTQEDLEPGVEDTGKGQVHISEEEQKKNEGSSLTRGEKVKELNIKRSIFPPPKD